MGRITVEYVDPDLILDLSCAAADQFKAPFVCMLPSHISAPNPIM